MSDNEEEIVLNRYKQMLTAMCDKDEDVLNEVIKDGTTFTHMYSNNKHNKCIFNITNPAIC